VVAGVDVCRQSTITMEKGEPLNSPPLGKGGRGGSEASRRAKNRRIWVITVW